MVILAALSLSLLKERSETRVDSSVSFWDREVLSWVIWVRWADRSDYSLVFKAERSLSFESLAIDSYSNLSLSAFKESISL